MFVACVRCSYLVVFILWLATTMTGTTARCSRTAFESASPQDASPSHLAEATVAAIYLEANGSRSRCRTDEVQTIRMRRSIDRR